MTRSSALPAGCRASRRIAVGAVAGYLAGSVSFSQFVGERAAPGQDLSVTNIEVRGDRHHGGVPRHHADECEGACRGRAMMASIGLEAAKAAVPTLAMRLLLPGTGAAAAAASSAVVGHVFPAWNGFRGGYGMSPMIGGLAVLDPAGLLVTTGVGLRRHRRGAGPAADDAVAGHRAGVGGVPGPS